MLAMTDGSMRRLNMVESQLRTNKVTDPRIIRAMAEIPRERFLPARLAGIAYVDEDIPIGDGRYAMEPMVFARLVQAAAIGAGDVVLELGTGCGYGTAVLARLASTVVSVEADTQFAGPAATVLSSLGFDNAVVVGGDPAAGHPAQAPYDVIVLEGAVAAVPAALLAQLAPGGRLVAVRRPGDGPGRACLWTRHPAGIGETILFDANTPWLPGFEPVAGFAFG
jgi:protein-L-isoaspartate(D-aspartate) O-methyltransferase